MKTLSIWIGALLVALMISIAPSSAEDGGLKCIRPLDDAVADIVQNDGEVIAMIPVPANEFTHLFVSKFGGRIAISLALPHCILTPPAFIGTTAGVAEA